MNKSGEQMKKREQMKRQRPLSNKKAVYAWVSWVLLITFAILLAAIISYWMKDYIQELVEDMQDRALRDEYCDSTGIEIDELVVKNAQTLNMKVINTYNLAINQIIFRLYDHEYILINITNVTIKPDQNKTLEVPKNLTTSRLEAVPVIIEGGKRYICNDKMVVKNII
ncbi:hypothetical protein ACFL96_03055 [Thermoproteota archaeon]